MGFLKQGWKKIKGYIDGAKSGVDFASRVIGSALDDGSGHNIYQQLTINLRGIHKDDNLLSLNTLSRLCLEIEGIKVPRKFDNIISRIVEQDVESKRLGLLDKASYKKALKNQFLQLTTSTKDAWKNTQPKLLDSLSRIYDQSKKISDLINTSNKLEANILERKDDIIKLLEWTIAGKEYIDNDIKIKNKIINLSKEVEKIDDDIKIESTKMHESYESILKKIENELSEIVKNKDKLADKKIENMKKSVDKYLPINLEGFKDFSSLKNCIDNLPDKLKNAGNDNITQVENFINKYINIKPTKSKKPIIDKQKIEQLTLGWFKSRKIPSEIENNVSEAGWIYNSKDRNLLIRIEKKFKYFFKLLDEHNANLTQQCGNKVEELNKLINLKYEEGISDKYLLNLTDNMEGKIYAMIKYYDTKGKDYKETKRWLESNKEIISKIKALDTSYSTESILLFKWFPKDWKNDLQWKDSKLYKNFKEIEKLNKQIEDEKKKISEIPNWNNIQFDLKNDAELFNCINALDKFVSLFKNKTSNIDKAIDIIHKEIENKLYSVCKSFNKSINDVIEQHGKSLGMDKANECPFGSANVNLYKFMKYLENQAKELAGNKNKIKNFFITEESKSGGLMNIFNNKSDMKEISCIVDLWEKFTDIKQVKIASIKNN